MKRPDDCTLTATQRELVRKHARLALSKAEAFGVFPTPVSAVMESAKVLVAGRRTERELSQKVAEES